MQENLSSTPALSLEWASLSLFAWVALKLASLAGWEFERALLLLALSYFIFNNN